MSTSGTTTFSQTCDEVILDAFELIGVYGSGRTLSGEDQAIAMRLLNKMIKAWGAKGLHLWTKEEGVLFLQPSVSDYTVGTGNRATLASDLYIHAATATASGSSTIVVDDASDISNSDKIGVVLSDKTVFWTTVVSKASNTITLTAPLTGTVAEDAVVYTYTTDLYKPLRILDARYISRADGADTYELPLSTISYESYYQIPVKNTASMPNQIMYQPRNTTGIIHLWPQPSDGTGRVQFTYERILEDLSQASSDFDLPGEWLETITYQLAIRLGLPFGKTQKVQALIPFASLMLEDLMAWDREITEVTISPDVGDY